MGLDVDGCGVGATVVGLTVVGVAVVGEAVAGLALVGDALVGAPVGGNVGDFVLGWGVGTAVGPLLGGKVGAPVVGFKDGSGVGAAEGGTSFTVGAGVGFGVAKVGATESFGGVPKEGGDTELQAACEPATAETTHELGSLAVTPSGSPMFTLCTILWLGI